MPKKKAQAPKVISNRRARFDYELGDSLVVGLELTGGETKSLRLGHGSLRGAYVTAKGSELYLIGCTINGTIGVPVEDPLRSRKVLAKRREIEALVAARKDGRTIVPLELLTRGRYIKLRISVGKGKKRWDKRETIKQRDLERDVRR